MYLNLNQCMRTRCSMSTVASERRIARCRGRMPGSSLSNMSWCVWGIVGCASSQKLVSGLKARVAAASFVLVFEVDRGSGQGKDQLQEVNQVAEC